MPGFRPPDPTPGSFGRACIIAVCTFIIGLTTFIVALQ